MAEDDEMPCSFCGANAVAVYQAEISDSTICEECADKAIGEFLSREHSDDDG